MERRQKGKELETPGEPFSRQPTLLFSGVSDKNYRDLECGLGLGIQWHGAR